MDIDNEQQEIEKEFSYSWDRIEIFYTDFITNYPGWEWLQPIHGLIAELRKQGYDKQLRAGQGLFNFILSRSRKHGLRHGQACLEIHLHSKGGMLVSYFEGLETKIEIEVDRVGLTSEVDQLLLRLLSQPID